MENLKDQLCVADSFRNNHNATVRCVEWVKVEHTCTTIKVGKRVSDESRAVEVWDYQDGKLIYRLCKQTLSSWTCIVLQVRVKF